MDINKEIKTDFTQTHEIILFELVTDVIFFEFRIYFTLVLFQLMFINIPLLF